MYICVSEKRTKALSDKSLYRLLIKYHFIMDAKNIIELSKLEAKVLFSKRGNLQIRLSEIVPADIRLVYSSGNNVDSISESEAVKYDLSLTRKEALLLANPKEGKRNSLHGILGIQIMCKEGKSERWIKLTPDKYAEIKTSRKKYSVFEVAFSNEQSEKVSPLRTDVACQCVMCGKTSYVVVNVDDYHSYLNRKIPIQNIFSYLSLIERESLISGYCVKCQSKLFNF